MNGILSALRPMFLATGALVFGQVGPPVLAKAAEEASVCNLDSLPSDIQTHLKQDFGSWMIQNPKNLSENARKTWAGRKPPACPGIAVGLFQNAKTASYAVLLVPASHPDAAYRFLVFTAKLGGHPMNRQLSSSLTTAGPLIISSGKSSSVTSLVHLPRENIRCKPQRV
jgi:hypothetical protein